MFARVWAVEAASSGKQLSLFLFKNLNIFSAAEDILQNKGIKGGRRDSTDRIT